MSIAVITQEMFKQSEGTLSSGNLGAFASMTGSILCRVGGPRLSTDTSNNSSGGSGDPALNTSNAGNGAVVSIPTTQQSNGAVSYFVFMDTLVAQGSNFGFLFSLVGGDNPLHGPASWQ